MDEQGMKTDAERTPTPGRHETGGPS